MKILLGSGEEAEATSFDAGILTLLSPRAFVPGSPIQFSCLEDGVERPFEGRALGSKRVDDELFEVRLRFVNLRRADRELLLGQLQ